MNLRHPFRSRRRALRLFLLLASALPFGAAATEDRFFAVYAGRMSDAGWRKTLAGNAGDVDVGILAGALGRTLWRGEDWSFEVEANGARHFGEQRHWEFNAFGSVRFHGFPWRAALPTSVAFGAGPSYATRMPEVEVRLDGDSAQWMLFWHLELTLGPPSRQWEVLFRLHHRSTGYGLFGETGGGNVVAAGLRYFY